MAIAVAFRFREREYYQELNTGDELLMGCHKKDTVQIPNSKEHLLIMKNVGDEVKAAAAEPPAGRQELAGFVDAYSSTSKNFVKILGNFEYTNPAQVWYNLKL